MTLDETSPALIEALRRLGDEYGPLGVAEAAAQLTDPAVLIRLLTDPDRGTVLHMEPERTAD